jgi:hypothetical protein
LALLIVLPLAQAAFLWATAGGGRRHGTLRSWVWALRSQRSRSVAGAHLRRAYVAALATGLVPRSRRLMTALALLAVVGLAMAWGLRALRPSPYFVLYDPHWPFNATLRQLSVRQLWILSLEKGWYSAPLAAVAPADRHGAGGQPAAADAIPPLAGSAMAAARDLGAVLLTFNPLTAVALGWLVTPGASTGCCG